MGGGGGFGFRVVGFRVLGFRVLGLSSLGRRASLGIRALLGLGFSHSFPPI